MSLTLIARISNLDQVNVNDNTINYIDDREPLWESTFSKLNNNDNVIFLNKKKIFIGKIINIVVNKNLIVNITKEFNISGGEILYFHSIFPEYISRVKANFFPFIHENNIDITELTDEIEKKKNISYYIIQDINSNVKINFNNNDRIIVLKNNLVDSIVLYSSSTKKIKNYEEVNSKLLSKDKNLLELSQIQSKKQKKQTTITINKIIKQLSSKGIYKFKSFSEYHDCFFNQSVYSDIANNDNSEYQNYNQKIYSGNVRNYFKFAPGSNAKFWDEFYNKGIVAVGFNELDIKNLEEVKSYEDLQKNYPNQKNTNQLWNIWLLKDAKVNDVVFANKGRNEVIGIGVFKEGKYFYDPNHEYHHQRKINWITNKQLDFKDIIESKTLFRPDTFSPTLNHELILNKYLEKYPELEDTFIKYNLIESSKIDNTSMKNNKNCPDFPKNQILYGPPGTGKTYNTVRLAVQILDCLKDLPDYNAETINKYNQYKKEGRLSFITFHQNFSYEDFVQGLRPDPNSEGMNFIKSDGIFKKIVDKAKKGIKFQYSYFSVIWKDFLTDIFQTKSKMLCLDSQMSNICITVPKEPVNFEIDFIITNSLNKQIDIKYQDIRKFFEHDFLPSLEHGISYDLAFYLKEVYSKKPYVIIIDEINRANISRVFGELITLIEDDKRWSGVPDKVNWQVTLPSGDPFVIPNNLYIIGTMNTADKSIALLDVALRRRFTFKAMYPIYHGEKGINYENICYSEYLKILNSLIVKEIGDGRGHDLQIGHSYFMKINNDEEFIDTMNDKVIPLLMEYFMNNVDDVKKLITSSFDKEVCNENFEIMKNSYPIRIQKNMPNKEKTSEADNINSETETTDE